jgi:hypothetical protein
VGYYIDFMHRSIPNAIAMGTRAGLAAKRIIDLMIEKGLQPQDLQAEAGQEFWKEEARKSISLR